MSGNREALRQQLLQLAAAYQEKADSLGIVRR